LKCENAGNAGLLIDDDVGDRSGEGADGDFDLMERQSLNSDSDFDFDAEGRRERADIDMRDMERTRSQNKVDRSKVDRDKGDNDRRVEMPGDFWDHGCLYLNSGEYHASRSLLIVEEEEGERVGIDLEKIDRGDTQGIDKGDKEKEGIDKGNMNRVDIGLENIDKGFGAFGVKRNFDFEKKLEEIQGGKLIGQMKIPSNCLK
jgi:hypothetical protein